MKKSEPNATLVSLLNTDNVALEITDNIPFLRIRIYAHSNGKDLDFDNVETYGFDFKTLKTTTDTLSADLWFKIEKKEEQPTTILTCKSGGIIPITVNQVKSSLLHEKNIAPTYGYMTTYKLFGNEEGFFVLCRDGKTYGKVILEKSAIDISSPDGKGSYYKEFGKRFSCLYQPNGSTDLTYPYSDIDLEDYFG